MDACMGMMFSRVPLLTHQSCRVSTINIPTFSQQCNLFPQDILFRPFRPYPYFLFHIECFFQFQEVGHLDKDRKKIETTHWFKHCVAKATKPICTETVNLYPSSCCVKALNATVLPILNSGLIRWKYGLTISSKLLNLLWWVLNLSKSRSNTHIMWSPVGTGWNVE